MFCRVTTDNTLTLGYPKYKQLPINGQCALYLLTEHLLVIIQLIA